MARVVAVGLPHHVTQRGNNRQRIFDSDEDRFLYLKLLEEQSGRHGLRLWGYCLMDNHVHLIAAPRQADALARTLRQAHADYARYANVKRRASGHFWQNRYFSCLLDGSYCWRALAYVERNPVRAGIVEVADAWSWSSAGVHLKRENVRSWLDLTEWRKQYSPDRWREVLCTTVAAEADADRIREATRTGRPLGEQGFVREMEWRLKRRLTPGKPGPRAQNSSSEEVQDLLLRGKEIGS